MAKAVESMDLLANAGEGAYHGAMKQALEILLDDRIQRVFDSFSACFGTRTIFFSPDGQELKVGLNTPDSCYCRRVQTDVFTPEACLLLDAEKREEAVRRREMLCYECHAGCHEVIVPIFAEESLLGFAMIGQFRVRDVLPSCVTGACADPAIKGELAEAYRALPFFAPDKISDVLGLFTVVVDYIVSQNMISLKGNLVLHAVIDHLRANIDRTPTLDEVSKLVHKSPSAVSHLFKQQLGVSFKQTMIDIKLEAAEQYLRTDPEMQVQEAAWKVGYRDPFLFSRIYKKHRGFPPSQFRGRDEG